MQNKEKKIKFKKLYNSKQFNKLVNSNNQNKIKTNKMKKPK